MDSRLIEQGDDCGTVGITFGQDDSFTLGGYGSRGGIKLELPLDDFEARELIDTLQPIADDPHAALSIDEREAVLSFIVSVLAGAGETAVHDALPPAQRDAFAAARAKLAHASENGKDSD